MRKPHPMEWARKVTHGVNGEKVSATEKVILLLLADYPNAGEQESWPLISTLASESCLSERSVRYALKGLKDKGIISIRYIKVEERTNAANRYRLLIPANWVKAAAPVDECRAAEAIVEEATERLTIRAVSSQLCAEGGILDDLLSGTDPTTAYITALQWAEELAATYPELSKDPVGYLRNAVVSRAAYDIHGMDTKASARLCKEAKILGPNGHARVIQALTHTASAEIKGNAASYVIAAARSLSQTGGKQ